jgi:pimeloyl-ACP methyl ester carboxylesterase
VHGWSGNSDYFQPLIDELAAHFRLVIPELRGHGRSTNPSGSFTTREAAKDMLALLQRLELTQVRAIGASAGALILMHMALEDPTSVDRMILVGSGTHFPPHCKASMAATDADSYPEEWWEIMRSRHPRGDEQIRAIADILPRLAAADGDVTFTPELLATIEAPTFIVHGDSDWCFPPSLAAEMHEAIPNSSLWVIPWGEHVPILGDWAPEFLRLAMEFLDVEG